MTRRFALSAFIVAAALAVAGGALAGQAFVLVNSDFFQDTRSLTSTTNTLNAGDVVIWRWVQSGHTVISGTTGSAAGDGKFSSDPSGTTTHNLGTLFSWKTTSGTVSYYCRPHFAFGMKGTINIGVPATPEADFRITPTWTLTRARGRPRSSTTCPRSDAGGPNLRSIAIGSSR